MINTATGTIDSWRDPEATGKGWSDGEERFVTMVRRMDACVGDLLQTLRDLGIDDDTLVIFSADNGPHDNTYITGEKYAANAFDSFGPFEGIKRDCYEGGMRQPTFAWWPESIAAGGRSERPSQFHDWMATFCHLAGVPTPARSDGVSLVPILTGEGEAREGIVYTEFRQKGSVPKYPEFVHHAGAPRNDQQVIFLEGYKGVRIRIQSHDDPFEIYDVRHDPAEGTDLFVNPPEGRADEFAALQQRMKDRVLRVRQPERDDPFDPGVDKVQERPYDGELVPAVEAALVQGVEISSFEGEWPWLPEFDELEPVAITRDAGIDVGRQLSRPDHAGLRYRGYLKIPADGTWTFHATSDAGTHLRIHESQVIDDDFNHDGSEASGSLRLAAGLHPFTLYYRSAEATPALTLQWSGPGVDRQSIPESVLFRTGDR